MKKIIAPAIISATALNPSLYAGELSNLEENTFNNEIQNFSKNSENFMTDNKSINELDLEPIIVGLTLKEEGPGWSIEKADRVAKKYKAYLYLVHKYPDKKIVPSKEVDEFWHAHILDTYKYMVDCDAIFGSYLHHYPYYGMQDEADKQDLTDSFKNTYELYLKEFPSLFSKQVINRTALCIGENPDARTALCIGENPDARTALCIGENPDARTALCIGENPDAMTNPINNSFNRNGSFNTRPRPTINRSLGTIKY